MDRQRCYQPQRILDMDPARNGEQRLNYPSGMWFDTATQVLYVAEAAAHQIRRFQLSAGVPTTITRELPPLGGGYLSCPMGLTRDREGNFLIPNMCEHTIVRIDREGRLLQRFGAPGTGPGQLYYPGGVVEDPRTGRIFVSDTGNQRIVVFGSNGAPFDYFNAIVLPNGTTQPLRYPGALAVNQDGVLAIDNGVMKYLILLR
jgi:sugar lactone lactonase YvrE